MNNMLMYKSDLQGKDTFRWLPLSQDCAYHDVAYDPNNDVLIIVSKSSVERLQMVKKLNDKGNLMPIKHPDGSLTYAEERRLLNVPYDYYITNVDSIKLFAQLITANGDDLRDFYSFLNDRALLKLKVQEDLQKEKEVINESASSPLFGSGALGTAGTSFSFATFSGSGTISSSFNSENEESTVTMPGITEGEYPF